MARGKKDLDMARAGYRDAQNRGDREEEARWANQIGHLLKARGEYVEALKWFRIDYDLSLKHLPQKQLMPTCQSIGEMYLRLQRFRDALAYQKKHLEFAQEADDLEEQQRASTQLCRTFFDIYDKDENNYSALRKAKKYSQMSLELARTLKENPPGRYSPSFVRELVNAYNNKGLLKIYLEDYKQAERVLMEGLRICDEEEVGDNDEVRTRLHHNLARIYMENREWTKAREHANIDIGICQHIPHPQGEAQGFINLGVIHCKLQKYEDALRCFNKALAIARSLEDEDALAQHIESNIETTEESQKIMDDLVKGEQHLKKLDRNASTARGTPDERGYYIQQFKCLKQLIDLASQIQAWTKHLEFAKRSNSVAKELGDKEKLGDALLAVGESYYNLRKFDKANKWYTKSWKLCATICNLEGQAVAKINIGNALDSAGNWSDALEAFQEGYKTAVQAKIVSLQITALQNMHYSYLLRFDNLEDARKLEHDIERLKGMASEKEKDKGLEDERCSETASSVENSIDLSVNELDMDSSPYRGLQKSAEKISLCGQCSDDTSNRMGNANPIEDDLPLSSYMQSCKKASQKRTAQQDMRNKKKGKKTCSLEKEIDSQVKISRDLCVKASATQRSLGCKRSRILLSDDDKSNDSRGVHITENIVQVDLSEVDSTDNNGRGTRKDNACVSSLGDIQNDLCTLQHEANMGPSISKCNNTSTGDGNRIQVTDNIKNTSAIDNPSKEYKRTGDGITLITPLVMNHEAVGAQLRKPAVIPVRVGETVINLDARGTTEADLKAIDWLKIEVAQLFCLHLYNVNKSLGMKPVVQQALYKGNVLESAWLVKDLLDIFTPGDTVEAIIDGWVRLALVDRYLIFCRACGQIPNSRLLSKLHSLKISEEEEVAASGCELQDESVQPLLRAIGEGGTFSLLDLSHNSLGNQTVHGIQEMISASNKKDLGLTLDLHDNQLGSSALLQICHCPVSLSRLEVLNLSGNHLTDASARHLCAILEGCQALAILNLERCSLTTRTIQKISNALPVDSGLVKLSIGGNNPISGNAIADLLKKLCMLKSFSDLDMMNVELNKMATDGLCHFLQASTSISGLAIGGTRIGMDGALKLSGTLAERTMTLTKVNMASCGLDPFTGSKLCGDFILHKGLLQLDLSGNQLEQRGACILGQLLQSAECHLKMLMINKCHLGKIGILRIIQALAGNHSLQELGLAGNNIVANETVLISETELSNTACCVEEVTTTQNHQVESFGNKGSNCSDQHGSPTSAGHVFVEGMSAENYILAEEHGKLAPLTCLEIDQNQSMAYAWDKSTGNKHRDSPKNDHQSNRNSGEYVVSDSEDEGKPDDANCFSPYDNCAGTFKTVTPYQGHSHLFLGSHTNENASQELEVNASRLAHGDFTSELSSAICMARNLQCLDLSDNFLPLKIVEQLYVVWSSHRRAGALAKKHIDSQVVHFCVEGKQCCGVKLCCQRDLN